MEIRIDRAASIYQAGLTAHTNNVQNKMNKEASKRDIFEASQDGMGALKAEQEIAQKGYDLSKVMAIHKKGFHEIPSREESEYYWAARKSDPELDARLYEQDKAEALKVVGQVQSILMKAVTGQELTAEEEEMVRNDPALQQEIAKRKAESNLMKR